MADAHEDVHGTGDGKRDALGTLQGEGLGDELAEENLEVGDQREGENDGDGVGVDSGVRRQDGEPGGGEAEEHIGDDGLADPAESETRLL